jgi:hypothetical protein
MTDDMVEFWWDDNAVAPVGYQSDGAKGTVCYVDKGKRVRMGALPKGNDPFLSGPCYPGPT